MTYLLMSLGLFSLLVYTVKAPRLIDWVMTLLALLDFFNNKLFNNKSLLTLLNSSDPHNLIFR